MDLHLNRDLGRSPAKFDVMTDVSVSGHHMLGGVFCPQLTHFLGTDPN